VINRVNLAWHQISFLCWCAVKKLLTHSLTRPFTHTDLKSHQQHRPQCFVTSHSNCQSSPASCRSAPSRTGVWDIRPCITPRVRHPTGLKSALFRGSVSWDRPGSRYCCYGYHAAGSKPIWKLFNLGLFVPKIISEGCDLVKLCYINRSAPGFFLRYSVSLLVTNKNSHMPSLGANFDDLRILAPPSFSICLYACLFFLFSRFV